jgi:hypothetical protein
MRSSNHSYVLSIEKEGAKVFDVGGIRISSTFANIRYDGRRFIPFGQVRRMEVLLLRIDFKNAFVNESQDSNKSKSVSLDFYHAFLRIYANFFSNRRKRKR